MKNICHKKMCRNGPLQTRVEPPLILLIKSNNDAKLDQDCVKIKLCRDTTSKRQDICEFKMALFDKGESEELLLFVHNSQMKIEA